MSCYLWLDAPWMQLQCCLHQLSWWVLGRGAEFGSWGNCWFNDFITILYPILFVFIRYLSRMEKRLIINGAFISTEVQAPSVGHQVWKTLRLGQCTEPAYHIGNFGCIKEWSGWNGISSNETYFICFFPEPMQKLHPQRLYSRHATFVLFV